MKGYSLQGLPDTYAKVALGASSAQRGIAPMQVNTQAPVGTQAAVDPFSNPSFNGQQALREMQQKTQAGQQAMVAQAPQYLAGVERERGRMTTDASNAENLAQTRLSEELANRISAMGGDMVLMRAASIDPTLVAKGKLGSAGLGDGIAGVVHRDVLQSKGLIA